MTPYVLIYLATAPVMLILDGAWLSLMAGRLYRPQIGHLMRDGFSPFPALLFYFLFLGGLVFFVSLPCWDNPRWAAPLWRGAAFGLVAYATYDLTNQATLRGWQWLVTGVDMAWGMILGGVSAALGVAIARVTLRLL